MQRSRRIGTRARALGTVALALALAVPLTGSPVASASSSHRLAAASGARHAYAQTKLVSSSPTGGPAVQDTNLINPWGIAFGVGANATPLWVANEGTATSTLYTGGTDTTPAVTKLALTVTTPSSPTGVVVNNNTSAFKLPDGRPSKFIFDTLSGQIAGWAAPPPPTSTTTMVTKPGAVFTGLAIAETPKGTRLYAADAGKAAVVRVYNGAWKQVRTFTDNRIPKHMVPYNVATIGKHIFVSFAPALGKTATINGQVDVFTFDGKLTKRLIVGGKLDEPWGMVMAPSNWGKFSGDLLVGNRQGGVIHAYGRHSGVLQGAIRKLNRHKIKNNGLWGMQFGNGIIGTPRTLIIAAGINDYTAGIVAAIKPVRGLTAVAYAQRRM